MSFVLSYQLSFIWFLFLLLIDSLRFGKCAEVSNCTESWVHFVVIPFSLWLGIFTSCLPCLWSWSPLFASIMALRLLKAAYCSASLLCELANVKKMLSEKWQENISLPPCFSFLMLAPQILAAFAFVFQALSWFPLGELVSTSYHSFVLQESLSFYFE